MSSFPGKAADKSNFTQTCNLLTQFFKEKRSSSLPFTAKTESKAATVDLLKNMKNSDEAPAKDFLPQFMENQSSLAFRSSFVREIENPQPQMTIFYDGKVLVFDAFPPEKATEVMEFATKLGSDDQSATDRRNPNPTCSARAPLPATHGNNRTAQQPPRSGPQSSGSDMRYPRRASLVKFLEKRKERVIAKGPYQKQEGSSSGSEPAENQSSENLDLNL